MIIIKYLLEPNYKEIYLIDTQKKTLLKNVLIKQINSIKTDFKKEILENIFCH